eukprot:TRINITY_DN19525_c0_g1_i1.p1 TRINITY_DN19525_c0_g1~~TRINITY_DN19525_c0_g1_i1.p1  ORF type:complete len:114 (+),score=4.38 TRINITY_DN19525_c0_g1_i1:155-496(+)
MQASSSSQPKYEISLIYDIKVSYAVSSSAYCPVLRQCNKTLNFSGLCRFNLIKPSQAGSKLSNIPYNNVDLVPAVCLSSQAITISLSTQNVILQKPIVSSQVKSKREITSSFN